MEKYIISLDSGTTSCRSVLFNNKGEIVSFSQKEFSQLFPKNGWVEHNPVEIWETQLFTLKELIKSNNLSASQIEAIGITNQRETTVLWNKNTGKPVYNAIVWQDNRTKELCNELINEGLEKTINDKTGLVLDSYFSGTKINWILENIPEAKDLAKKNLLLFGTIDTWLLWNLSKKNVHATDISNASRTLLYNIKQLSWDKELLSIFKVPSSILPEVKESSCEFGFWEHENQLIPISGIAGDQQAALFGQCCFDLGNAKNTYGTGCFMLMNTGNKAIKSNNGLLTTIGWSLGGKVTYALEGSVFIAGAAVQWLRDGINIISTAQESEQKAISSNDNDLIFVPAFSGLGAPYWNMDVKGGIFGITRDIGVNELCKATLESLAFQTHDVLVAMEKDANIKLDTLAVDGGACANDYLMQFQANILNSTVNRPKVIESTALGAAYLAGLHTGYFKYNKLKENHQLAKKFHPELTTQIRKDKIKKWHKAIESLINMHQ